MLAGLVTGSPAIRTLALHWGGFSSQPHQWGDGLMLKNLMCNKNVDSRLLFISTGRASWTELGHRATDWVRCRDEVEKNNGARQPTNGTVATGQRAIDHVKLRRCQHHRSDKACDAVNVKENN
jgi:hypothetical protein